MPLTPRSRLEALFDTSHRRLGRWYLPMLLLVTILNVVAVTMPIENITQVPLWTGRGFEEWRYIFVFMAAAALGPIVLVPIVHTRHRALFRVMRGEEVSPVEVWRAAVTKAPLTAMLATLAWSLIIIGIGMAFVGHREGFSTGMYVAATIPQLMMMVGSGAFYFMFHEVAWLPFARAAAPKLPTDFVDDSGLSLRRRLILITTAMTFTIGCASAGVASGFADREARIWAVVLGTALLVATFVGPLLLLLHSGITRRVNELVHTISSIGSDRQTFRAYPSSGDEFDAVGRALNRTVDLLDERARGLQESRARLVAVADETRRRTERDLHDGAQQHVAMVSVQLALLARKADPGAKEAIDGMRAELGEALDELRTLAHGIYPVALEHEGLIASLTSAGRQSDVDVVVAAADDLPRWPAQAEVALYFCCWELIRSVKPGAEIPVRLALGEHSGWGSFYVSAPVDASECAPFLRDRIGAVGGELSVTATPEGLVAHGTVPLS